MLGDAVLAPPLAVIWASLVPTQGIGPTSQARTFTEIRELKLCHRPDGKDTFA
jgi:hypothetical protein